VGRSGAGGRPCAFKIRAIVEAPDAMPDVRQRALDPRVAPRRILRGHPDHQAPDLGEHAAPAKPDRVRPLPGDELTMPPQQRIGRHDRGDLAQRSTAHPERAPTERSPIRIGQAQAPPSQLPRRRRFSSIR
jgi:hypothetical protein